MIQGRSDPLDNLPANTQPHNDHQPQRNDGEGPGIEHGRTIGRDGAVFAAVGLENVPGEWGALVDISICDWWGFVTNEVGFYVPLGNRQPIR